LAGLGTRPRECPAVLDAAVLTDDEVVHEDLDVREGRHECLGDLADSCRFATIDRDRATGDVVLGDLRGIAAAPRFGVRACELLDLRRVAWHRLRTSLTPGPRRDNPGVGQCSGITLKGGFSFTSNPSLWLDDLA